MFLQKIQISQTVSTQMVLIYDVVILESQVANNGGLTVADR
jgi:hypothetical protein